MKIVCICSTKNEGDIIEAFVRLNGKTCDSFFFVDESTDNTREIIGLLVKEGYDLNFLPKSPGGHNQPNSTKALISAVVRSVSPDWIFLLDADEIIVATDKRALIEELTAIAPNTYLTAPWKTYVPINLGYFESASPLSDCFAPRKEKGETFKKASIPGCIADDIVPTTGNHRVQSAVGAIITEQVATSYYLAHFPVRSAEQIIVKNLIATNNLMTRADACKGEGFHVFPVTSLIRARDYKLTLDDLQSIAINYARADETHPASVASELDLQREPELRTRLTYLELGRINVLARLDAEIERLSKELRGMRRGFTLQSVNFRTVHRR